MDKLHCIENVIRCIKVIIVLKLAMVTSTSISLTSLSKICCVDVGTTEISSLPKDNLCTAIATYSGNKKTTVDDIRNLRENLPLVYIVNDGNYDEMTSKLNPEPIIKFIENLSNLITDQKINVMIIDNLYPSDNKEYNSDLQDNICTLINELKKRHPDTLFGLVLSQYIDIMKNAFNLDKLNSIIDVFLPKTYSYIDCTHHNHQSEMANTSPVDDMSIALKELTCIGYNLNKLVLTIEIIVNSVRHVLTDSKDIESYSSLCSSDPGKNRKYCTESLSNFYQKGLLVNSNKMLGCLIKSVDRDDYNNQCQCGNNPVLKCISAGINGGPEPTTITACKTFGLLPRDRK